MPSRILVAYASREGSTSGIAGAIADELRKARYETDVKEIESVHSLEEYDALVIGTPVYSGKFLGDIAGFAARHRDRIAHIPVAGFVVGIAPVYPKAGDVHVFTGKLASAVAPAKAVAITMFVGSFQSEQQGFLVRSLGKMMKIPEGDFRKWGAISAWARELPAKMGI